MQTRQSVQSVLKLLGLATITALGPLSAGCTGEGVDGDGDSETGGLEDCEVCDTVPTWYCDCYNSSNELVGVVRACANTQSAAATECDLHCPNYNGYDHRGDPKQASCRDHANEGTCSTWDPADEVTWKVKGGYYEIEHSFIDDLVGTPAPLWTCDDASVEVHAVSGFVIDNANSGELLYELGLRDDDRPFDLNGYSLDTWAETADAFGVLWLEEGETDYTLKVTRTIKGTPTTVELDYKVINPPS